MSDAPRLLILETSGRGGLVALARGPVPVGEHRLEESRRHARDLAPLAADLMRRLGWRPRDVNGILVSLGPGSYTGLRVGVAAAKAFAYATGCAVVGVETFAAVAARVPEDVERVDVISDAQQGRVYVQGFRREAGARTACDALRICLLDEWLTTRDPAARVTGPGVETYAARLAGLPLIPPALRSPTAESLLDVGLGRFLSGKSDDVWSLEPIYLRPSAAEEQSQRRK